MDSPPATYDEKDSASLEKGASKEYVARADDKYHFDEHDLDGVQRKLKQRHVQMIAVSIDLIRLLSRLYSSPC